MIAACLVAEGSAFSSVPLRSAPHNTNTNNSTASTTLAVGDSFAALLREPSMFGSEMQTAESAPSQWQQQQQQPAHSVSSQARMRKREGIERVRQLLRGCTGESQVCFAALDSSIHSPYSTSGTAWADALWLSLIHI